ncbi:MAG: FecR domain-containing protein [Desulfobulbaceae bacterium]|nr:FecR domain-containing protein [Desulfobulbaceae bacterium]
MDTLTLKKTLLLLFFLLVPNVAATAGLGELRLSLIEGDVQIKTADTQDWSAAVINFPLKAGDQIWVPDRGRAEVKSRRGSIVRLAEKSALDILTVENDALQFYLSMGLAYVNANGERDTTLQLDTPLSSVRVYERAKFSAEVPNERLTTLSVYLGRIIAESRKGDSTVPAGKQLSIDKYSADLSELGMIDSWERWNGDLDKELEEEQKSMSYLPEELAGYASDFDRNGEWVSMPEYGYVWRPTVQVTSGWAPYRQGRWLWVDGDYVWVAQEPWGWAPYHYGRWSFISRHGWCWVPPARHEAYWGPGYVGWVRTPTFVSWVPLAPREVYYGHGNYGPHSVNINHVDVRHMEVNNIYKNVSVENSVTTVHHDTFVRGKHVDFKVKENPFLKEKISIGRPQIEPERRTKSADVREIPATMQPPERIRNIDVGKLQKQHLLQKNRRPPVGSSEKEPLPLTNSDMRQTPRNNRQEPNASKGEPLPVTEVAVPTSQSSSTPPENSQEMRQQPPLKRRERQTLPNGITTRQSQPRAEIPTQQEEPQPSAIEQKALTHRTTPPQPEIRQERRQQPLDKHSPRDEIGPQADRQKTPPPARQEAPPPDIEQTAPSLPLATPPPETRQEVRRQSPLGGRARQVSPDEMTIRQGRQESTAPPQDEKPPLPAVKEESPTPRTSAPPLERSRHEERRRQPFEVNDRQTPHQEIDNQINRRKMQLPQQQDAPPPGIEQAVHAPQISAPPRTTRQEAPMPENRDKSNLKKSRRKKTDATDGSELPPEPETPLPEQTERP